MIVLDRTISKTKLHKLRIWDYLPFECAWKEDVLVYEKLNAKCGRDAALLRSMRAAKDTRAIVRLSVVPLATLSR